MRYLVPLGNWTDRVHCQSLPQVLHGRGAGSATRRRVAPQGEKLFAGEGGAKEVIAGGFL